MGRSFFMFRYAGDASETDHDKSRFLVDDAPITELLRAVTDREPGAYEKLFPLVYDRLRRMAQKKMNAERANHTLSATALVHEAFVRIERQQNVDWKNRAHFLSVAAMAMRRVLINHAEAKRAEKRGAGEALATFDDEAIGTSMRAEELLSLDAALQRLAELSERQAKVVELSFFGGLTHTEIAEVLEVSEPTVRRDWRMARAWLTKELA